MQSFSTFSECTTETAKLSISSQHNWHRSECLMPLCQSLLVLIHISWSGFIPHYRQGEQKNPSGTTRLCLETTDGEKLPCSVERSSQMWKKWGWYERHTWPPQNMWGRGLWTTIPLEATWSLFWRGTAHRPKEKISDIKAINPNRNTSPSSTAGFSYLFCLLSSCPLVGEKSPGQLWFCLLVTIYWFSLWNTVSTNCISIQHWITECSI